MALKFQPPQQVDSTSPNEAFNKGLGTSISSLPLLYAQTKQAHMESKIKEKTLQAQLDQNKFTQGIETQKVGIQQQEADTSKYKAEHQPGYVVPIYDETGNVTGYSPVPQGMKPFGGKQPQHTPEDKQTAKLAAEKPKALGSIKGTLQGYDNIIKEAQAIRNDPDLGKATGFLMGRVTAPGGASRVAARLDTLKSKTVISTIGSLKELSKNGATGFGVLSDTEGKRLEDSVQALKRTVDTPDFQAAIDRFISEITEKKQLLKDTYVSTYGGDASDFGGDTGGGEDDAAIAELKKRGKAVTPETIAQAKRLMGNSNGK